MMTTFRGLAARLVLGLAVFFAGAAPAAAAFPSAPHAEAAGSLPETRVRGQSEDSGACIKAAPSLAAELQRGYGECRYDNASGCTVAPGGTGARFADNAKLADHFGRHGGDFGAKTASEYQSKADRFLTGQRGQGVLEKARPRSGDVVRYNPATEEFGVVSKDGVIKTYYKPDPSVHGEPTNLDYFKKQ
jgi:hypothetical protein